MTLQILTRSSKFASSGRRSGTSLVPLAEIFAGSSELCEYFRVPLSHRFDFMSFAFGNSSRVALNCRQEEKQLP
jgi:hypothetical protein